MNKIKVVYKTLKQIWQNPRYKSIIKLGLYMLMFVFIFSAAKMAGNIELTNDTENSSFSEIIKNIPSKYEYNVKVTKEFKNYNFDLSYDEISISGYLEEEIINKVKITDESIYKIINNELFIDEYLNTEISAYLLNVNNILNLINHERAFITKKEDFSSYKYNIEYNSINYEIIIETNLKYINKINIKNENIIYEYTFEFYN